MKSIGFRDRFPRFGIIVVMAIALAIPLTQWSLSHVPTQTRNYAADTLSEDLEVGTDDIPDASFTISSVTSSASSPTCPTKAEILSKFGANVTGTANCKMLLAIYNAYDTAFSWSKYRAMIKSNTTFNLHLIVKKLGDQKCGGYVTDKNNIYVYDLNDCVSNSKSTTYMIIHETGHLVGQRNSALYESYPISTLASQDSSCYSSKFLKTYNRRDTVARHESMAEASALIIINSRKGALGTITNFRTQCGNTYSEIKSTFFGTPSPKTYCGNQPCAS